MTNALNHEEEREISRLLSRFIGNIHKLTAPQANVVLEIDEHMRADSLTRKDLTLLKDVECGVDGR